MPQIRVSEIAYRELKARASKERRTLSAIIENLLIPINGEPAETPATVDNTPTTIDTTPTTIGPRKARVEYSVSRKGTQVSPASCTCGPGERAKGKHNKYCPMYRA